MSNKIEQDKPHTTSHFLNYRTLYIGLIFIVLGLAFVIIADPQVFWQKLISGFVVEVGFAFTIAWVIGVTIERQSKREHNFRMEEQAAVLRNDLQNRERGLSQKLSQNVFAYLYSVSFPRSAFTVMEKYIFSQPVIKKRQLLEYEIFDPIDDTGWIVMRCHFDYTLVNLSEKIVEHPIRFHASKVSGLDHPDVKGLGLLSLTIRSTAIPPSRFDEIDKAAPDDIGQQKFEEIINIAPAEEVRVRVTFQQLKRINDNDLYQSNTLCESLELKFKYNPAIFNAFLEPVHPSDKFTSDLELDNGDNCRIVTIEQPLLPKNGVFMWWNQKETERVKGEAVS